MTKHAARHRLAKEIRAAGSAPFRFDAEAVEWIRAQDAGAEGGADKPKRFSMTAYTGGPLQVSAYGPPVVIDLSGLKAKAPVPILLNHELAQIVGHADEVQIAEATLKLSGIISGAGPAAAEVQTSAGRGFPWRASVGARPDKMEFIAEGVETTVNGKRLTGPLYVARKATLGEVSFVAVGADGRTSAKVAASSAPSPTLRKDPAMDFDKWIQALGFDPAELREDQRALLKAKYDAETKAAEIKAAAAKPDGEADKPAAKPAVEPPRFDLQAVALAYEIHATAVQALTATYAGKIDAPKLAEIQAKTLADSLTLKAKALTEQWSEPRFAAELVRPAAMHDAKLQRAERPTGPAIHASSRDFSAPVIEAAFCRHAGLPAAAMERTFKPEVLEASDHKAIRGFGVQQLLLRAAYANGYEGRNSIGRDNLREVMKLAYIQAGASTIDVAGILSNLANKFLLAGFDSVPQTWRQVATVGRVNDFKENTFYRLTASLEYEQVPASGKIKEGTLGEESYTASVKTYAKLLALSRTQIINDDLGAFDDIRRRLGLGSVLAMNKVFWKAWIAASNAGVVWSATHKNLATTNAFGEAGIAAAVKLFRDMPAPDGGLMGLEPAACLVPSTLEPTADKWYKSEELRDTTASTKTLTTNIYKGKYPPIVIPELESSAYGTGYSASTWWLLSDPAVLASAAMYFLDGVESPTVESAEADFDELGIQFRGYHDFGCTVGTEYRASVKSTA